MTCGDAPRSTGPDANLAALTLTSPSTGRSGTSINLQAILTLRADLNDLSVPAAVNIVRNGRIVGAYRGAVGGTGLGAMPGSTGTVPTEPLLLSGCPRGPIDYAHPDATRQPLPAGNYQLIATIDTGDNDRADGLIASAPVTIRVID